MIDGGPISPHGKQPGPHPIPGTVKFTSSQDQVITIRTSKTGVFSGQLPRRAVFGVLPLAPPPDRGPRRYVPPDLVPAGVCDRHRRPHHQGHPDRLCPLTPIAGPGVRDTEGWTADTPRSGPSTLLFRSATAAWSARQSRARSSSPWHNRTWASRWMAAWFVSWIVWRCWSSRSGR